MNRNNIIESHGVLVWRWAKKIPSFLMIAFISIYQFTFSPDHGVISLFTHGQCKFRPTCSQYTKKAISDLGVIRGLHKGFKQIMQCH